MLARFTVFLALLALSPFSVGQEKEAGSEVPPVATANSTASETAAAADGASNETSVPFGTDRANEPGPSQPDAEDSPAQGAKLKELLSLVQDNTLEIHKRENPAYYLLMKDVLDRTTDQLREAVTINPRFNDLYKKPSEYRGQLVNVNLNARRVLPLDIKVRNAANVTRLYEIWGWTEEAKAWMYCCVVPELPEGFPEEGDIVKRIELTGYFFKMQAYQPGNAAPNARNLVAPLIIGRIVDAGPAQAKADNSMGNWPLILIIGFGSIVMFRIMLHLRGLGRTPPIRRNYRRRSLEPIDPDALDDALDGPERGIRIRNAGEV